MKTILIIIISILLSNIVSGQQSEKISFVDNNYKYEINFLDAVKSIYCEPDSIQYYYLIGLKNIENYRNLNSGGSFKIGVYDYSYLSLLKTIYYKKGKLRLYDNNNNPVKYKIKRENYGKLGGIGETNTRYIILINKKSKCIITKQIVSYNLAD